MLVEIRPYDKETFKINSYRDLFKFSYFFSEILESQEEFEIIINTDMATHKEKVTSYMDYFRVIQQILSLRGEDNGRAWRVD